MMVCVKYGDHVGVTSGQSGQTKSKAKGTKQMTKKDHRYEDMMSRCDEGLAL